MDGCPSRSESNDLDDRDVPAEANDVAVLELVLFPALEHEIADERPVRAADVLDLHAARAGRGEQHRVAARRGAVLELDREAAGGAFATDQVLTLVDRIERAEIASLVAHEEAGESARRVRVDGFWVAPRSG